MRLLLVALLIVTLVLIVFTIYSIISYLIKKKEHTFIGNLLLVIYFTFIIGYISFNKTYPYSCTMDFRYIIITLLPSGYFIFWKLEQINNKLLTYFIRFMILLFIILCIVWVIRLQICNYVIDNYIGGSLYV